MASRVGIGWSLQATNMISRSIVGIPDEETNGWFDLEDLENVTYANVADGGYDSEPDIFNFSIPGYSGKFVFPIDAGTSTSIEPMLIPRQDVKITRIFTGGSLTGFKVISPDGTIYYFGTITGSPTQLESSASLSAGSYETTGWYLVRIESYDGLHQIDFAYETENYRYPYLASAEYYLIDQNTTCAFTTSAGVQFRNANNQPISTNLILGKRLSNITNSSGKVNIDFIERSSSREDVESNGGNPAKALDRIEISSGTFDKQFVFYTSYFTSPTDAYDLGGGSPSTSSWYKRLKLDSLQEKSIGGTPITINPYIFEYHESISLEHRLTHQIDSWGFQNGQFGNSTNVVNVPPTTVVLPGGGTTGYFYGNSNRDSDEDEMLAGILKKITYPTKGYTEYSFGANEYYFTVDETESFVEKSKVESCFQSIGQGYCCTDEQSTGADFTLSSSEIDSARLFLDIILGDNFLSGNCFNQSRFIKLIIHDESTDDRLDSVSFAEGPDAIEYPGAVYLFADEFPNITAGTYYFTLETENGFGRAILYTKEEGLKEVGGLRIEAIRHFDESDNLFDSSTYDYSEEGSSNSSGQLYSKPIYGAYFADGNYYHLFFRDISVVPLGSFDGYHIGYERVVEIKPDNGKAEYNFYAEPRTPVFTYPLTPDEFLARNGRMVSKKVYDESGNVLDSTYQTYVSNYNYLATSPFKLFYFKQLSSLGGYCYYFKAATYTPRTGYNLILTSYEFADGVSFYISHTYDDNEQLFPISQYTANSDGRVHKTEYSYPSTYTNGSVKDSLLKQNRIIPWQTLKKVDNTLVDGQRTSFAFFSSAGSLVPYSSDFLYPYLFERYELTWDAAGNEVSGADWKDQQHIFKYQEAVGLPAEVTIEGWDDPIEYTWDTSGNLLNWKFLDLEKSYKYFNSSNLLHTFTDIDSTQTTYAWDNLMRLESITDCDGVESEVEYHYWASSTNINYIHTTINYPLLGANTNQTVESVQFLNGLGSPIQQLRYKQNPANETLSIAEQLEYDTLGRLIEKHEPVSASHSPTNYSTASTDYTESQYEASPRKRMIKTIPPGDLAILQYEFGTNATNEVSNYRDGGYYSAGTLYKTTIIDGNGDKTIMFTDILGNEILSRQLDSAEIEDPVDTYTLYDDKNRPYKIFPPETTNSVSDSNLVFTTLYHPDDLIKIENAPDKDQEEFIYNERDLLAYRQDGYLNGQNQWYALSYDDYGRIVEEGFTEESNVETTHNGFEDATIDNLLIENTYGSSGITRNRLTQQQKKVLGTEFFIRENYEYDDCGDLVVTRKNSLLHPGIGSIVDSLILDDAENVIQAYKIIKPDTTTVRTRHTYDHVGREINTFMRITTPEQTWTEEELCEKTYTVKEQISDLNLGDGLQDINYTYLPNRFLSAINTSYNAFNSSTDLFGMNIGYDKHLDVNIQNQVYQYDGKIAGIQWRFRHTNGVALAKQAYRLKYNFQDMLTEAEYFEAGQSGFTGRYKATFSYIDQRGNFDVITRNNAGVQIDNLDYSYKSGSNQLEAINDGTSSSYSRGYISNQNQYQHNANGYITYDAEIGANIIRDHLNHINYLEYDTIKITHQRDASGQLYRTIYDSAGITTTIDRCGMLEFRNGVLGLVHHNNGYVTFNRTVPDELLLEGTVSHTKTEEAVHIISNRILNNGADEENIAEGGIVLRPEFEVKEGAEYLADLQKFPIQSLAWHYIIRDHLGSPRVTFQDINNDGNIQTQTEIEDNKNYYPFGLEWDDPEAGVPKFRKSYNNKEAVSYTNYLAFEVRNYIRSASVFDGPDPLASDMPAWSPYSAMFNNPIRFTDPTGMAPEDIIDIDKATGNITVTKAAGNDVVRLVNNGDVQSSYTYGSNGSFSAENTIYRGSFGGTDGVAIQATNSENAQTFYKFAAQSDVEFGKVDATKDGDQISVVTTTGESNVTSSLPEITSALSKLGFTGVKQSHSHPDGQSVPSGHYDNVPGNPYSLSPVPPSHRDYTKGDAQNARQTRSLPGFQNTKFEVYNPRNGSVTTYDGINKAKIRNK